MRAKEGRAQGTAGGAVKGRLGTSFWHSRKKKKTRNLEVGCEWGYLVGSCQVA